MPKYASPLHIRHNAKISYVETLTRLEEWLVSPRVYFSQIRKLRYKRTQLRWAETIINIDEYLDKIENALPRVLDDSMTIAVFLKHRLEYINAYLSGNVQPKNVMLALNELCKTMLYQNEGIVINTY